MRCLPSPYTNGFGFAVRAGLEESIRRLRRENLAGLTGRVLEVGAGIGLHTPFFLERGCEVTVTDGRAERHAHPAHHGRFAEFGPERINRVGGGDLAHEGVVGVAVERAVEVVADAHIAIAAGLGVDAVIHLQLAAQYQLAAPGGIGQGNLFRIQAIAAALAALWVLLRRRVRDIAAVPVVAVIVVLSEEAVRFTTIKAEMRARDYARLVLSGLRGETSISVVHSLLARAQLALTQYAEPGYSDQGLAEIADRLVEREERLVLLLELDRPRHAVKCRQCQPVAAVRYIEQQAVVAARVVGRRKDADVSREMHQAVAPALGHPRVWLEIDEHGYVDCGYCDRRFVLQGEGGGGHH